MVLKHSVIKLIIILSGIFFVSTSFALGKPSDSKFVKTLALAKKGNVVAECQLADMYFSGEGVKQDYLSAADWYKKAAEKGDATAQFHLGIMYDKSQWIKQDDITVFIRYNLSVINATVINAIDDELRKLSDNEKIKVGKTDDSGTGCKCTKDS